MTCWLNQYPREEQKNQGLMIHVNSKPVKGAWYITILHILKDNERWASIWY